MYYTTDKSWILLNKKETQNPDLLSSLDISYIDKNIVEKFHCKITGGELDYLPGNKYGPHRVM